MKRPILITIILLAACRLSMAAVYVDSSSPGPLHDGKSWKTAYLTITNAVSKTRSGDIWVKGGLYRERVTLGTYHRLYGGFIGSERLLTQRIIGAANTVIDAEQKGRAIDIPRGAICILDGFVIVNGSADSGAGVRCATNSTLAIRNCRIENCTACDMGGAVYFGKYTSGEVSNSTIIANSAKLGGGLVVEYHSYPVISRTVIAWNNALDSGGGAYCPFHSGAKFVNCTLACNTANATGGAVYAFQGGPVTLISSILAFNNAQYGGGIFGGGVTSATTFTKCCFFGNTGGDWAGAIRTPPVSARNIFADPLFANPRSGDFRLLPGSPCKGVGA